MLCHVCVCACGRPIGGGCPFSYLIVLLPMVLVWRLRPSHLHLSNSYGIPERPGSPPGAFHVHPDPPPPGRRRGRILRRAPRPLPLARRRYHKRSMHLLSLPCRPPPLGGLMARLVCMPCPCCCVLAACVGCLTLARGMRAVVSRRLWLVLALPLRTARLSPILARAAAAIVDRHCSRSCCCAFLLCC